MIPTTRCDSDIEDSYPTAEAVNKNVKISRSGSSEMNYKRVPSSDERKCRGEGQVKTHLDDVL